MKIQQLLRQLLACRRRCRHKGRLLNMAQLDMHNNRIRLHLISFNPRHRLPAHLSRQRKLSTRHQRFILNKLRLLFNPVNPQHLGKPIPDRLHRLSLR